ncbi:MAG: hypothetical protein IKR30_04575 [Bacteroidales bacterium]|nr:hypothetical protein [Bacteroidales bacterium]
MPSLAEYYESLPPRTSPKTEFVKELVAVCNVDLNTAKLWVRGKTTPSNPEHRRIMSRVTGIPEEELFPKLAKPQQDGNAQ